MLSSTRARRGGGVSWSPLKDLPARDRRSGSDIGDLTPISGEGLRQGALAVDEVQHLVEEQQHPPAASNRRPTAAVTPSPAFSIVVDPQEVVRRLPTVSRLSAESSPRPGKDRPPSEPLLHQRADDLEEPFSARAPAPLRWATSSNARWSLPPPRRTAPPRKPVAAAAPTRGGPFGCSSWHLPKQVQRRPHARLVRGQQTELPRTSRWSSVKSLKRTLEGPGAPPLRKVIYAGADTWLKPLRERHSSWSRRGDSNP